MMAVGLCPFEPCHEGGTPSCVHFSAGACQKSVDLFSQSLLYVSGHFHTFGPFPERIVFFQVSGTLWRLKASFAIKGLTTTISKHVLSVINFNLKHLLVLQMFCVNG